MARRANELFIGREHLNIEGRTIKHPALLKLYASLNINKVKTEPLALVGLDLETDSKTAELKLLGFYGGEHGSQYTSNFLYHLFRYVKICSNTKRNIAYWNRLDPFVLYKQLVLLLNGKESLDSLRRFGKVSGEWNRETRGWDVKPVIEIQLKNNIRFGIKNVIRSSVQFFWYRAGSGFCNTVWAFDIAQLYENGLEKEALFNLGTKEDPKPRLPYYTKIDESAHLIDWDRFKTDSDYKNNIVLRSNMLDARAVYDLGMLVQEDFKKAFGYYPNTLISTGSLARAAIVATVFKSYDIEPINETDAKETDPEKIEKRFKVIDDINSISFMYHRDDWADKFGSELIKDLYCLTTEAYSGGLIESLSYGYSETAWTADLSGAYPAEAQQLFDLRGAVITKGNGVPPEIANSYCFIRGKVTIPSNVNVHPLTVKHPVNKETNIRPTGTFRASYIKDERDFLIALGATFEDEEWINVETKGELSTLAKVSTQFSELRTKLLAAHDSSQIRAKQANNSIYGILFEAVETYSDMKKVSKYHITDIIDDLISSLSTYVYDVTIPKTTYDELITRFEKIAFYHPDNVGSHVDDILEAIFSNANTIEYTQHDPIMHPLKKYLHKLNLSDIREDLKYHFGDDNTIFRQWHSKNGLDVDQSILEIEQGIIPLDGDNTVDKMISLFYLYQSITKSTVKNKLSKVIKFKDIESYKNDMKEIIKSRFYELNYVDVINEGYRAGEFWNPLYATIITARTRIKLSKAANAIEAAGGEVMLLMTDSVFWNGTFDMLPKDTWAEVKTGGLFEKPEMVKDFLCLGSGRYEYTTLKGDVLKSKRRGLNVVDIHNPDGVTMTDFSWLKVLNSPMSYTKDRKVKVKVRTLISVGLVLHNSAYNIEDLGLVKEDVREVDVLVGVSKRIFNSNVSDPSELAHTRITTRPIPLGFAMFGDNTINDQTLPVLREKMMVLPLITKAVHQASLHNERVKRHYQKIKGPAAERKRENYEMLRKLGFSRKMAMNMRGWSQEKLKEAIIAKG